MIRKSYNIGFFFLLFTQLLIAQNSITIGNIIYQKQAFSPKDKEIFDSDEEGLRVWSWAKAQQYCTTLKLDDSTKWRVASRSKLKAIMVYLTLEFVILYL